MAEEQVEQQEQEVEAPSDVVEQPTGSLLNQEERPQETAEPQAVPEGLPEKFKSVDDLLASYNALEKKLGSSREDIKNELEAELLEEAYSDRPADVGDYQIPETLDPEQVADNKLLNWWADHAWKNGYSQDEFEQGINLYVENFAGMQDDGVDYNEQMGRLGDNAQSRVDAVSRFVYKNFKPDQIPAIEKFCETADGIIALEQMMGNRTEGQVITNQANTIPELNEMQLKEMMKDDRYHNPSKRDPNFVRKVDEGFKKLFG